MQDMPEAAVMRRRRVRKSVIVRRLHSAGKLEATIRTLANDPLLRELWNAADADPATILAE